MIKDDVGMIKDDVGMIKDDVGMIKNDTGMIKDDVGMIKNTTNEILSKVTDVCDEGEFCFGLGLCSNSTDCPSINKTIGGELDKDCLFGQCLYRFIDNGTINSVGNFCDLNYFDNVCKAFINLESNEEIIPCLKISSSCTFNQSNTTIEIQSIQCSYFFKCTCGFVPPPPSPPLPPPTSSTTSTSAPPPSTN